MCIPLWCSGAAPGPAQRGPRGAKALGEPPTLAWSSAETVAHFINEEVIRRVQQGTSPVAVWRDLREELKLDEMPLEVARLIIKAYRHHYAWNPTVTSETKVVCTVPPELAARLNRHADGLAVSIERVEISRDGKFIVASSIVHWAHEPDPHIYHMLAHLFYVIETATGKTTHTINPITLNISPACMSCNNRYVIATIDDLEKNCRGVFVHDLKDNRGYVLECFGQVPAADWRRARVYPFVLPDGHDGVVIVCCQRKYCFWDISERKLIKEFSYPDDGPAQFEQNMCMAGEGIFFLRCDNREKFVLFDPLMGTVIPAPPCVLAQCPSTQVPHFVTWGRGKRIFSGASGCSTICIRTLHDPKVDGTRECSSRHFALPFNHTVPYYAGSARPYFIARHRPPMLHDEEPAESLVSLVTGALLVTLAPHEHCHCISRDGGIIAVCRTQDNVVSLRRECVLAAMKDYKDERQKRERSVK